jgi:small-conductance mechanosensitive channel
MHMVSIIERWLETVLGLSPGVQLDLLQTILAVVILVSLRHLVLRFVYRRTEDIRLHYHARKFTAYTAALLAAIIIARIWFQGFREISTYLGLLSAGIAIALKDLVASIAGWVYLLWRRPFEVGDRIQIGEHAGDVVDIRLFRFTLMEIGNWVEGDQSTGRIVHVPNSRVITDVIANYTRGFEYLWNELPVMVTFESNWERAKKILEEIAARQGERTLKAAEESARKAARRALIHFRILTPRVWTSVGESGVVLTIRYLCEPRSRRSTAEEFWEEILRAFRECDDIDLAYPTVRRYINPDEGKPGTGGRLRPRQQDPEGSPDVGSGTIPVR